MEALKDLFTQILEVAHETDLLEVGDIVLDGTKVKANASKHKALSYERAWQLEEQLTEEVEELLRKAEEADQEDLPDELSVPEEIARWEERLTGPSEPPPDEESGPEAMAYPLGPGPGRPFTAAARAGPSRCLA